MEAILSQPTSYDDDIQALNDAVDIVFQLKRNEFKELAVKYQNELITKSGTVEFELLLKKHIQEVNNMLSKVYKKKILSKYYSEYGMILTIHGRLKSLYLAMYSTLQEE